MHLAAQVLPQLVLPVGLTLLLALAGVALRRRWLVLLALALLWIASSDLTSSALWRVVEAGQERVLASDASQTDAVVVLSSCRRTAPGDAGVRGWDTAERFLAGLELIQAERAPRLVFTGRHRPRRRLRSGGGGGGDRVRPVSARRRRHVARPNQLGPCGRPLAHE